MNKKVAVIDLGTNTFHLLIAEIRAANQFKTIFRKRHFVKLAEEGIQTIGKKPLARGFEALKCFREILDEHGIKKVKAIGTAALRTASNGAAFIKEVKQKYNIQIELIDGSREAELIYKGVTLAVPFKERNYLLMDIGGGSVEFIIANQRQILWAQSFPIGVAVLYKNFHQTEPMAASELYELQTFLNRILKPLCLALKEHPCSILVGASGTFDVLEFLLSKEQNLENHAFVAVKDFFPLYLRLLRSTKKERFDLKEIPDTRADMIVVALVLIEHILKLASIKDIIVSNFAMKEGILSEMM
jgi:exopolyphosphatase/guanosine-5'-triphosphate,3'-diphosphate pyrophosphatase